MRAPGDQPFDPELRSTPDQNTVRGEHPSGIVERPVTPWPGRSGGLIWKGLRIAKDGLKA